MENENPSVLPLLLLLITSVFATSPPPPSSTTPANQVNNIIDALIGSGDFNSWKNLIADADPTTFPLSVTFFVPSNETHLLPFDPFIFPYHIVPQRLSFADLRLLRPFSRLPTLLPQKSILVTNSSADNFTLDDSRLSHPDQYLTSSIAVHGVQNFLDYKVYGGKSTLLHTQSLSPPPPPTPPLSAPSPPPPPPPPSSPTPTRDFFVQEGAVTGGGNNWDASACSCRWIVFLACLLGFQWEIYWSTRWYFLIE